MTGDIADNAGSNNEVIAELQRRHRKSMQDSELRHQRQLDAIYHSYSYRIGAMIVALRSPTGWRALPGRLRSLAKDIRATPDASPREELLPQPDPKRKLRTLSILDEFSEACLGPELDLVPAGRRTGSKQLANVGLVFAESAWQGNRGTWKYAFSKFDESGDLARLLSDARSVGIPSVFWNKEDPVGFDTFLPVASQFDYVVTSDAESIARYDGVLKRPAYVMPFAAQPALHNPIGRPAHLPPSVCFAGAWRGDKYPRRAERLEELLDAAQSVANLTIYDREPTAGDSGSNFPQRFHQSIAGRRDYASIVQQYRMFSCFLNVNTVEQSSTMMARRVFEILACRTPVVSTPAGALDSMLPGVVIVPQSRSEATSVISALVSDPDYRDRVGHLGYRAVMSNHTYEHRVDELLSMLSLDDHVINARDPLVDVICVSNRPEQLEHLVRNISTQKYPAIRTTIVLNSDAFDMSDVEASTADLRDVQILRVPEDRTLGECLNIAIEQTNGEFFAKFDDDDFYGADYLSDMMLATKFADAAVYGKRTFHAYVEDSDATVVRHEGHEFAFTELVMGGTLLARRAEVAGIRFEAVISGTDTLFLKACSARGLKIFGTDRFNYLMVRRSDVSHHTWRVDSDEFLSASRILGPGLLRDAVLI